MERLGEFLGARTPEWHDWFGLPLIVLASFWFFNAIEVWRGGEYLARSIAALRGRLFESYRDGLARGLDRLALWIGDHHSAGPMPFSGAAFVVCLGVSTFYPFLFLALSWALFGGSGALAGLQVFDPAAATWQRWFFVLALASLAAAFAGFQTYDKFRRAGSRRTFAYVSVLTPQLFSILSGVGFVPFLLVTGLTLVAFAASALYGRIRKGDARIRVPGGLVWPAAWAFVGVNAVVVGFGVLSAPPYAFVSLLLLLLLIVLIFLSPFVALLLARMLSEADRTRRGWVAVLPLALTLLIPAVSIAYAGGANLIPPLDQVRTIPTLSSLFAPPPDLSDSIVPAPLVLLVTLFPILNALFDWLSLAITRWLLARLAKLVEADWLLEGIVILVDFVLAVALAFLIVITTAGGAVLFSEVHAWAGGARLYDVVDIINRIRSDPLNEQWWWLYAMMFWTLVPTIIHFTAFAGIVALVFLLEALRYVGGGKTIADWIARAQQRKGIRVIMPSLFLTVLQLLPAASAFWLAYEWPILNWLNIELADIGSWLADASTFVARSLQGNSIAAPAAVVGTVVGLCGLVYTQSVSIARSAGDLFFRFRPRGALVRFADYDRGDYGEAIVASTRAISLNPYNADAFNIRGLSRLHKADYKGALADFDQAVSLAPAVADYFSNRGWAHKFCKAYDEAIEDFEEAIRLEPRFARPRNGRGVALVYKGDAARAIRDFSEAISLKSDYAPAFDNRGWARALANVDLVEALGDVEESFRLERHAAPVLNRGLVLSRLERHREAIAAYDEALTENPKSTNALYLRGISKLQVGDVVGGEADIRTAKATNPAVDELYTRYGIAPKA